MLPASRMGGLVFWSQGIEKPIISLRKIGSLEAGQGVSQSAHASKTSESLVFLFFFVFSMVLASFQLASLFFFGFSCFLDGFDIRSSHTSTARYLGLGFSALHRVYNMITWDQQRGMNKCLTCKHLSLVILNLSGLYTGTLPTTSVLII